ncbi:hypothetical protein D3C85_1585920 [compost metagenome]
MLPDCRCALRHLIQPGRVILLKEQLIRKLPLPAFAEHRIKVRGTDKAGRQVIPRFCQQPGKLADRPLLRLSLNEPEMQR